MFNALYLFFCLFVFPFSYVDKLLANMKLHPFLFNYCIYQVIHTSSCDYVMYYYTCEIFQHLFIICLIVSILTAKLTFWEDFTCLDVTQCILNRSILQVALKYLEFDLSSCLPQILTLGIKVCIPCTFHLLFIHIYTLARRCISSLNETWSHSIRQAYGVANIFKWLFYQLKNLRKKNIALSFIR